MKIKLKLFLPPNLCACLHLLFPLKRRVWAQFLHWLLSTGVSRLHNDRCITAWPAGVRAAKLWQQMTSQTSTCPLWIQSRLATFSAEGRDTDLTPHPLSQINGIIQLCKTIREPSPPSTSQMLLPLTEACLFTPFPCFTAVASSTKIGRSGLSNVNVTY